MNTYQVAVSLTGELITVVTGIRAVDARQAIAQVEDQYRPAAAPVKVVRWTGYVFEARQTD